MMKLAIIPARGGSVRIPHKNIKPFNNRPIIAYSILTARNSGLFDEVIVSTDDSKIADIAAEWGAGVPFVRPGNLALDEVGTIAVTRHAIEWFIEQGQTISEACCIYATAPFLTVSTLKRGYDLLIEKQANFTFSATVFPYPIQRSFRITETGEAEMLWPEKYSVQSHELEDVYHDAAQFYWGTAEAFLNEKNPFSRGSFPVVIPHHLVHDIDNLDDWIRAEKIFAAEGLAEDC